MRHIKARKLNGEVFFIPRPETPEEYEQARKHDEAIGMDEYYDGFSGYRSQQEEKHKKNEPDGQNNLDI